jgi:AcrR family transcriptional regulator
MEHEKLDRRSQRTRELLTKAFMELLTERDFSKITILDITEHANLGRTTFYTHFESKEALFLYSHHGLFHQLNADIFNEDEKLNPEPSPVLIWFLEQMWENRNQYFFISGEKGSSRIMQMITAEIAVNMEEQLHKHRNEDESGMPFAVLANYISGAMIALIHWWIVKRATHSPAKMAQMLHRLRNAALMDALKS